MIFTNSHNRCGDLQRERIPPSGDCDQVSGGLGKFSTCTFVFIVDVGVCFTFYLSSFFFCVQMCCINKYSTINKLFSKLC